MTERIAHRRGRFDSLGYLAVLSVGLLLSAGCNLCCPPYLDDYATVGGKWARANPTEGRVGSAFSDPGIIPASAESSVYPEMEVIDSTIPTPESDSIIELETGDNAPMILGEDW